MSWDYAATPEEAAAAELLRATGWRVNEPPCPRCHGNGFITESSYRVIVPGAAFGGGVSEGSYSSLPCPNGGAVANFYFATAPA